MKNFSHKNYAELLRGALEPEAKVGSVPDFAFNPLNLTGELYRPVIDELWIKDNPPPKWPQGKRFAVCLTHDVDAVSELDLMQNFRSILKYVASLSQRPLGTSLRWILIHKIAALKGLMGKEDLLCQFEKWMELENRYGAKSTLFFAPSHVRKPHESDCMYRFNQKIGFRGKRVSVTELMKIMDDEGWEAGLHPSWNAHSDLQEMKYQKSQIEAILGHSILSVRQHFLKFDPRLTHAIQAAAGFKFDSTLGYNDNVGFRRGTSYPFQCNGDGSDSDNSIMQIPLVVQDAALLLSEKGLRLDSESALKYVKVLLERVKSVGGVLTLSWHPHTYNRPGFFELYEKALELISHDDPWFGTVAEVGQWWTEQVDIDLNKFTTELSGE